jgi:hypothetical protein
MSQKHLHSLIKNLRYHCIFANSAKRESNTNKCKIDKIDKQKFKNNFLNLKSKRWQKKNNFLKNKYINLSINRKITNNHAKKHKKNIKNNSNTIKNYSKS